MRTSLSLTLRLLLAVGLFFALVWTVVMLIFRAAGVDDLIRPAVVTLVVIGLQYLFAPLIVKWTMRVRYVTPEEEPRLHRIVQEQTGAARIPMPRVGISELPVPNAFAFGRWRRDGRLCVTRPLLQILTDDELRAVVGHEVMHLKNRDVAVITLLSLIPNLFYYLYWYGTRLGDRHAAAWVVALGSLGIYLVGQLFVLWVSRLREYAADEGSVRLGNPPHWMASAFYKLVYGAAMVEPEALGRAAGFKAFFASDPSRARKEIQTLAQLDLDRSGTIDPDELEALRHSKIDPSLGAAFVEVLSTHPNMLKRVRRLADLQAQGAFRVNRPVGY